MTIPVIGTAVVNTSFWVSRLIMSIDYPVDNFVIINNNGKGELDEELEKLKSLNKKFINKIHICNLPQNIGCAGAMNLIIKCFMNSPYWIIANDDIAFGPGFLEEMVTTAEADPGIGMIHGFEGDYGIGSWDLFLIRDHIIKIFGLFDENTYPAYCEDIDYIMRFMHRPIRKIVSLNKMYYHGFGDKTQYNQHGSQTKKSNEDLANKLTYADEENKLYMDQKWTDRWRMMSPSEHPFQNENLPIDYTKYDLDFVRKKHLGF